MASSAPQDPLPRPRAVSAWGDRAFAGLAHGAAWVTLALLLGIIGSLVVGAMPAIQNFLMRTSIQKVIRGWARDRPDST